jgi:hypothetical protein
VQCTLHNIYLIKILILNLMFFERVFLSHFIVLQNLNILNKKIKSLDYHNPMSPHCSLFRAQLPLSTSFLPFVPTSARDSTRPCSSLPLLFKSGWRSAWGGTRARHASGQANARRRQRLCGNRLQWCGHGVSESSTTQATKKDKKTRQLNFGIPAISINGNTK